MIPDTPLSPEARQFLEPASNVAGALEFMVTRALTSHNAYDPELIRAVAATPGTEQRAISRKLKEALGRDLNLQQWNADVKEARAHLVNAAPSRLLTNDQGVPKAVLANAIILFRGRLKLGYDLFSHRVSIMEPTPWDTTGQWKDRDDVAGADWLQHKGVNVGPQTAHEAAAHVAAENEFHPVRDWLDSLHWDRKPRLDKWLVDYIGTQDSPLNREISCRTLMAAAQRVLRPGCKADYMPVLEGAQRIGKSRAIRALTNGHMDGNSGVQWFRDSMPNIDHDDCPLYLQGSWIIEIGELEGIRGREWTRVKRFLSQQNDPFRAKYGRNIEDHPRQCMFIGTTNESDWGGDTTGLTRFWPVSCGTIDIDGLLENREHLWAEAVARVNSKERTWLDDSVNEMATEEQNKRMPDDSWIEPIARVIQENMTDDWSLSEILSKIGERRDRSNEMHAARVMRGLGFERYRTDRPARAWRYRKLT